MPLAFLGLGRMGRILAGHLLDDGHDLVVWNRTASAADELHRRGATTTVEPTAAVDVADVVVTAFFGVDAVRQVVVDGDLPWRDGALWIDVTTVGPDDARELAEWGRARGIRYVHAPVVGSLAPARDRALGVLLGGPPEAREQARPVVASWAAADRLRELDDPAAAATGKLLANLALAVAAEGLAEALALGAAEGMDASTVLDLLAGTLLGPAAAAKGDMVRSGAYEDTQFSADLLAKDVRLMRDVVADLPAATAMLHRLEEASREGRGDDDFATVLQPSD